MKAKPRNVAEPGSKTVAGRAPIKRPMKKAPQRLPRAERQARVLEKAAEYFADHGEFGIAGKLVAWDVKAQLPQIKTPTLTIGGQFDTMDPGHMKWMSTQVQNGRYLYCENGSHMSLYDDQKNFFPGLISFIKDVDAGTFKK